MWTRPTVAMTDYWGLEWKRSGGTGSAPTLMGSERHATVARDVNYKLASRKTDEGWSRTAEYRNDHLALSDR